MARIPPATRDSVPEDQREAFDEMVGHYEREWGGVPPNSPVSIMINVPEMAKREAHLGDYLRFGSTLSRKVQELAMLVTSRELDCQYIWTRHASWGREAGLRDDIVDDLREKREPADLDPEEAALVGYGQELLRTHRVSQATFDAALAQFGLRGLMELTNLMGFYSLMALNVNAFAGELPEGVSEPPLPL